MDDDDVSLQVSLPLDSGGFLRRECPTCEREFKWLPSTSDDDEEQPAPDGGYFCPYCAIQAPDDAWWTQAQLELVSNVVSTEALEPMIESLARGLSRASGGFVRARPTHRPEEPMDPLTEEDDMKRVDFGCHPAEPVKVLDGWEGPVHCLVCGEPAA